MSFRINHDDDVLSVLDIVEKALQNKRIDVSFVNDEKEHDGYMIFEIVNNSKE